MMARPEKIRLGDLLIQQGLLTDEQIKFALNEQKRSGRKLGRIVVDSAFVTEEAISPAPGRHWIIHCRRQSAMPIIRALQRMSCSASGETRKRVSAIRRQAACLQN